MFTKWIQIMLFFGLMYMGISYLIIRRISNNLVKPIISLTNQIRMSIRKIRKLRRETEKQEGTYVENVAGFVSLQIDLLSGHYRHNKEINDLYNMFSQRVKVLFFAKASAKDTFDVESIFNLYEALQLYTTIKNLEGVATCLYILGCLYAQNSGNTHLDFDSQYRKAINYLRKSENIQQEMVDL